MSRVAIVASALALAAVGAFACSLITPPASEASPIVNSCDSAAACDEKFREAGLTASCVNGVCMGAGPRPILIVSVPLGPTDVGGNTFALSSSNLTLTTTPSLACSAASAQCDFLPPLGIAQNCFITVAQGLGVALWPPAGLRPSELDFLNTTLPVHGVFHPLWRDATGTLVLATKLGLPLADVNGRDESNPLFGKTGPTTLDSGNVSGMGFSAHLAQSLAPNDPSGLYLLEITPDAPYTAFPPFLTTISMQPPVAGLGVLVQELRNFVPDFAQPNSGDKSVLVAPRSGTFEIDESPPTSLEGWSAYIVNSDGFRVSGTVILPAGAKKNIVLYEATGNQAPQEHRLYLDPPPGVELPRYFADTLGTSEVIVGPTFTYPALPEQVLVDGIVRRSDTLIPTVANVVFVADPGAGDASHSVTQTDGTPAPTLLFTKGITTTAGAQFSEVAGSTVSAGVHLPPGVFRVYISPTDPDVALTTVDNYSVISGSSPQLGKGVFVNPKTRVQGRVTLGDGTPVFAADVVIDPSADLPLQPGYDPLARPRTSRGTTDVNGSFDVGSDPGHVDISIRPRDGTNFPWVVLTDKTVLASDVSDGGPASVMTLPTIVVPLPTPYDQKTYQQTFSSQAFPRILTDSVGNALPNTIVRAYVFPAPVLAADGGIAQTRAARLVGMTTTDEVGAFQLFVAPLDP